LPPATVDNVVADIQRAGDTGRRVALVGAARNVGTTLTTIALARALARNARVIMVDLAFVSPNLDVISDDPAAPGIAELVRGAASFGDIITRDRSSRAHVVAAGRVEGDPQALVSSHMFMAALDALAQSYEYLVVDMGAASGSALTSIARVVPRAVLVAGDTAEAGIQTARDQMRSAGFHDVAVLTGPPPAFEQSPAGSVAA
jgi:Mrp family chromosome partitioning ATPase